MPLARSPWLSFVLALCGPLAAQQSVLPQLRAAQSAAEPGSVAWFAAGCDVAEAELLFDVPAAMATATSLWSSVTDASPSGARQAVAALAALVSARHEGPEASDAWRQRVGVMPAGAAPLLQAHYHLATARHLCVKGLHAQELGHSIPGQACADQVGDFPLRLRAAMTAMQATPQRSVVAFRRLMDEASRSPQAAATAVFRPWLWIEEAQAQLAAGHGGEAERFLTRIEDAASRDGNRRALGIAASLRSAIARRRGQPEVTRQHAERALQVFTELGDLK